MNVETFFQHHQIRENPFAAEEARQDAVFKRLLNRPTNHPDFGKILGDVSQPAAAVVFGEKGSGKTAIRLQIGQIVLKHNGVDQTSPDTEPAKARTMIVAYDDLNPVLDRYIKHVRQWRGAKTLNDERIDRYLADFRLADHQDAILSLAVTQLIDNLLDEHPVSPADGTLARERVMALPKPIHKHLKRLPRQTRLNLAMLAALYDQPSDGDVVGRWGRLRRKLKLGWGQPIGVAKLATMIGAVTSVGLTIAGMILGADNQPGWLTPVLGLTTAAAVIAAVIWLKNAWSLWRLARGVQKHTPTISRSAAELRAMLKTLRRTDLKHQPWPDAAGDVRYDLTRRLLDVLKSVGYHGLIVLVDRVDEPTLISGRSHRMRAVIWPMMDNKFLQQPGVGHKLLLPVDLRYLLLRESPEFFHEARLDKQNLVDRLSWSGPTLYDLCNRRLQACSAIDDDARENGMNLADLFEADVARPMLIEALDQMHQPRDAFKFLYAVVQEHCRTVSVDEAAFRIPRLTLESVRRQQSRRVQELYQGHSPA